MRSKILSCLAFLPPLALLALLLLTPSAASEGARSGISVCTGVIVPSLFPFLILSSLLSSIGMPEALASLAAPLFRTLGLPPVSAAPFLLGLCGGYPVGAVSVAALVRSGAISPEDGSRMLPYCNNTGPGFIVGVAGGAVFASIRIGLFLYLCHVLSALTLALLFGRRCGRAELRRSAAAASLAAAFPASVGAAAEALLSICAYVVFFSMLTAILRSAGLFSSAAALLALRCGTELRFCTAMLTGLLELGSGIAALRGAAASVQNLMLAAFLLGFGGLSVHAQTLSAVSGTDMKCARHFAGRILHGLLSAAYVLLLFRLLRI